MLSFLKKGLGFVKKAAIVFIVYFVVISLFFYFTNDGKVKQTVDPTVDNRKEIYRTINDPELNKTKEGRQQIAIYRATMCGLIGEACTDNPKDADKNFNTSFFGYVTGIILLPYTHPPASGVYWVYDSLQKTGFVPQTYAAEGIGFGGMKPFINIWQGFRNFAYMILVIVLITIGFMIMFRVKINPQTIINVENSLPRFIVILIAITFSFAIGGFLIDLMYVSSGIIVAILSESGKLNHQELINQYIGGKPSDIFGRLMGTEGLGAGFWRIFWTLPNKILAVIGTDLSNALRGVVSALAALIVATKTVGESGGIFSSIGKVIGGIFTLNPGQVVGALGEVAGKALIKGAAVGAIIGVLFQFVMGFFILATILFLFIRLLIILIKAYVKVILLIIFAPIYLLIGAIPNQSGLTFASWIRNLAGELVTFPALIAILIVGSMITNTPIKNTQVFQPPFTWGLAPDVLAFLLGMAVLFLTPELIKSVKKFILPKESAFPSASPALFFGGVAGGALGGHGAGILSKFGSLHYSISGLQQIGEFLGFKTPQQRQRR